MQEIDLGNGAICEIDNNGDKLWYLYGERHRTDGPAIDCYNGDKCWFLNDKLHRADGPAVEYADGSKKWYVNGIHYSEEDFEMIKEVLWAM
jgi:hypothetical protein